MRGLRFWLFLLGAGAVAVALSMLAYAALKAPRSATLRIGVEVANAEARDMAHAIADVVHAVHGNIVTQVVETSGAVENARMLTEGKIELALVEANSIIRQNVALVTILYPDLFQLVVRAQSGIESVGGLERHRIALPPVASGQFRAFWSLANHYGVAPERLDAVPMSEAEASKALLEGEVDALFRVAGIRNSQIRQLINQQSDLRLVPIDQGSAMNLRDPAFRASIIPKGAYRGDLPMPPIDLPTLAIDRILVARANLDDGLVRMVTAVLFENRRSLTLRIPLAAFIAQPTIEAGTLIPVHPGALEYYNREQPSLLEEKAEFLALLLSLGVVFVTAGLAVKRRLDESKKSRIEDYAAQLLDVEGDAKASRTIPELNRQKERLTVLLARVVDDMRARRVNAEGLQLFAFVWESVNYTVNDHEEQLRLGPGPSLAGDASPRLKPPDGRA